LNPRAHSQGTRALLEQVAAGIPAEGTGLDELLDRFNERAYGLFLLLGLLPSFLPLPAGAGSLSGGIAVLLGLQLCAHREHPWLPRWLGRRRISADSLQRFLRRFGGTLRRLERLCRPRWEALFDNRWPRIVTGLCLIVQGVLLALPLPLTNYPFAGLMLPTTIALIERDGRLLAIGWASATAQTLAVLFFSSEIAELGTAAWRWMLGD
jgi:hypothetical protein